MPQRERMCTLSGFTKTSNILKTLHSTHYHTIPPTHIHQSENIMWKASHTHTNRQLIFRKASYEPTNIQPLFCLFHTCTYTLKQFSLHIHEAYSLGIPKAQDFEGFQLKSQIWFQVMDLLPNQLS